MTKNKDQWVWVVGGGIMQVPMIKAVKDAGCSCLVTDANPQAPGAAIADMYIQVSTYDVSAHLDLAESMTIKPIAILTAGADVGPTVSAVAETLGLPAVPYSVAMKTRNKLEMRRALIGLPQPMFVEVDANGFSPHSYWKNFCRSVGIEPYPCVLKPLELSGSKGVSKVESPWQWENALREARLAGETKKKSFIVEEFIKSTCEVALDFFAFDGNLYFANGAFRLFRAFGIEIGHINPYTPTERMIELAKQAAEKLGVTFGPFKVDFIVDKYRGPLVVECATRLSGGFDHMMSSPMATGRDITGAMLELALGKPLDTRKLKIKKSGYAAVLSAVNLKPGKVKNWVLPEVDGVELIVVKNEIKPLNDCTDRALFAVAPGTTPIGALVRASKALKKVEVEYE